MESEKLCTHHAAIIRRSDGSQQAVTQDSAAQEPAWRRKCGCLHTSARVKELLKSFPAAPPPSPIALSSPIFEQKYITGYCREPERIRECTAELRKMSEDTKLNESKLRNKSWEILAELVHLVQLSVMATALALYYVIYCYMQLIYYTLRSALYFHNADGPMKITIGVVTITSVIIGFNLLLRMEKLIGIYLF